MILDCSGVQVRYERARLWQPLLTHFACPSLRESVSTFPCSLHLPPLQDQQPFMYKEFKHTQHIMLSSSAHTSSRPASANTAASAATGLAAIPDARPGSPSSSPFSVLPALALELIFSYLPHPQSFALINKEMYTLTQTTHVRALWFLAQWGKSAVLSRAAIHSTHGGTILCPKVLPALIRRGADVTADGWFVVQHAADSGYVHVLDMVLDNVSDAVRHDPGFRRALDRALMVAADNGCLTITQLALHHGANINTHSSYPLRYAAYKHHLPLVKYLLKHGARPTPHAVYLTVAPIREHLVRIQNLPGVSKRERHGMAQCPVFKKRILKATEILRWLVWFSTASGPGLEEVADKELRALESLPNYPLDATGSRWFVDQPPRIVVTPPPNPLSAGTPTAEQVEVDDIELNGSLPSSSVVPPPPTPGHVHAPVPATAQGGDTLPNSDEEQEPHVVTVASPDLQVEGLTTKLGTVYPFAVSSSPDAGAGAGDEPMALVASSAVLA
ncbi:hypothetical protein BCR44DRAFT_34072 [Catenaria anguillulae PL171]|uniref:Uncharacterized protein n=1 Tax=Catenaria anguillulae PL171 TaxID=765915 RepID=A0A1Y2HUI0_9FUNG|nr:hypothetical protein BCR44DRAFT_34072 [Catenaria anguillulae PL171]